MTWRSGCRLAAWAAAVVVAAAPRAKEASPPDVSLVDLPPLIRSTKGPANSDWSRSLLLIAGRPHGKPAPELSMLSWIDGKPAVASLALVHPECRALSVEASPDRGLRVLVGRPGGIDEVSVRSPGSVAQSAALVEDADLDPLWLGDRPDLDGDGRDDLLQATFDGVSLWRREEDGRMSRLPGSRLPPEARFDGEWLTVRGKYVVAPVPAAPVRWTWPETHEGKRLRTYKVPIGPEGGTPCTAWIDAEAQVYAAHAVFLSGEPPRLVALVAPADKLAFFGNLSLLAAPLVCDETSRGRRPTQRIQTDFESNIGWTGLDVTDVTGDGRRDVLIVGRQGIVDKTFEVAVHHGLPDGGFAAAPASGVRSDLEPLSSNSKSDVDGDGRIDLVVLDRTRVMWARGIAVEGPGDLPFDLRKPVFVPLPDSVKPLYLLDLVDLDGDGRLEAVIAGEERKEEGKKKKKGSRSAQTGGAADQGEKDSRLAIVRFPAAPR